MNRPIRYLLVTISLLALLDASPSLGAEVAQPCERCDACTARIVETLNSRGWLGLGLHLHDRDAGLVVAFVDPQGPAAQAGLLRGDRVIEFQGIELGGPTRAQVRELLHGIRPGERVELEIESGDERRSLVLRATEMPARAIAEAVGAYYLEELSKSRPKPDTHR